MMSLFSYCLRANCRSALFDFYVDAFKARLMLSSRSRTVENLKRLTQFQLRPLHNFDFYVPIYKYQPHAITLAISANIHATKTHFYLIYSCNDHYNIFARKSCASCLKNNKGSFGVQQPVRTHLQRYPLFQCVLKKDQYPSSPKF